MIIDHFLKDPVLINDFWNKYIMQGQIKMCLKNTSHSTDPIPDSFTSLLPDRDFLLPLIHDLKIKLDQNYIDRKKIKIKRWHINIHPTGYDGSIHKDNEEECPTFLYCLCPSWNPDWGGEFIIYDQNKEAIKAFSFKSDRMIIFNGSELHRGVAPTRLSSLLRVTIAFHTELLENEEKNDTNSR